MMKLNHVNLTVTNVSAAAEFFANYFEMHRKSSNDGLAVLSDSEDDNGMILTLMKAGRRAAKAVDPVRMTTG